MLRDFFKELKRKGYPWYYLQNPVFALVKVARKGFLA
jgi:hypothetical protein